MIASRKSDGEAMKVTARLVGIFYVCFLNYFAFLIK